MGKAGLCGPRYLAKRWRSQCVCTRSRPSCSELWAQPCFPEWQLGSSHFQLIWTCSSLCSLEYRNFPPPQELALPQSSVPSQTCHLACPPSFPSIISTVKGKHVFFAPLPYRWIFHFLVIWKIIRTPLVFTLCIQCWKIKVCLVFWAL